MIKKLLTGDRLFSASHDGREIPKWGVEDGTALKNLPGLNKPDQISAAEKANLQAFNRIVLLYQDEIFALAVWILGDEDSAEEITQNTFLAAYRSMSPFRNDTIRRRLYQIATNTCFDKLQQNGYESKASDQSVQQALRQLDVNQRAIVFLVDLQDFSYREAAQILGSSIETVKSRLARARLQLHHQLNVLDDNKQFK